MSDVPTAPKGLSARSRRLWGDVLTVYELSAAELAVWHEALMSLDRADQAAKVLAKDGLLTVDRYGSARAHPATDIELRHRTLFARLVGQLGVKIAASEPVARRGARPGRREQLAVVRS